MASLNDETVILFRLQFRSPYLSLCLPRQTDRVAFRKMYISTAFVAVSVAASEAVSAADTAD